MAFGIEIIPDNMREQSLLTPVGGSLDQLPISRGGNLATKRLGLLLNVKQAPEHQPPLHINGMLRATSRFQWG